MVGASSTPLPSYMNSNMKVPDLSVGCLCLLHEKEVTRVLQKLDTRPVLCNPKLVLIPW